MENFKLTDEQAYHRAKKKAQEIKGFYCNLFCYCIVVPFLIFINLTFSPQFYWFWFSAIGWGIGVVINGFIAFGHIPFLSKDWEERKLKQFMEQDKQASINNKKQ